MAEITIRISDRVIRMAKIVGTPIGVILIGWVSLYLWSSGFFRPKYHLKAYLADVSGVQVGAPVRLDGFDIGNVETMRLAERPEDRAPRIEVVLHIERRIQDKIRSDSAVMVLPEGLLGQRYLDIDMGSSGAPLGDGDEIAAVPEKQMTAGDVTKLTRALGQFSDCMKTTIDRSTGVASPQPSH